MIIEECPLKKGRFIIQEVHEIHEKRINRNPRHESISQYKKVFMTTHYKNCGEPKNRQPPSLDYSSLVYDHSIGQWVNFDSIWEQKNTLKANDPSFGKIFHYLYSDTGEDSSLLKTNEEISTIATTEKGLFKENLMKKPKSYSCLYKMSTMKEEEGLTCVLNESIEYKGMSCRERSNRRGQIHMEIIQESSFTLLRI